MSICDWGISQQITSAEYFFDTDPGIGNGVPLSITPGDTINDIYNFSVSGLTAGLHNVFIRYLNEDGKWSLYEGRWFYVLPDTLPPSDQPVVAAEYFFDTDPGIGNGTSISVISGDTINQVFDIPVTGITEGFHSLFMRFLNDNGKWSLYEGRWFYVQPDITHLPAPKVAAIEYFFDTDPGIGSGTAISLNPDDTVTGSWNLSTSGLGNGQHYLYVRVTDEDGSWSISQRDTFYLSDGLQLKVFLEGPFSGTEMNTSLNPSEIPQNQPYNTEPWNYAGEESITDLTDPDIVDWVLVELRESTGDASTATGDSIVSRQAAFLTKDGSIKAFDGNVHLPVKSEITDNLYSVILHRNHLGVMSADPLVKTGSLFSYDFSDASEKAFGGINGHKELVPGLWGMIAGDGDANGQVGNADKNDIWFIQQGNLGYLHGDFNMDSDVNNMDKVKWNENAGKAGKVPE